MGQAIWLGCKLAGAQLNAADLENSSVDFIQQSKAKVQISLQNKHIIPNSAHFGTIPTCGIMLYRAKSSD